MWKPEKRGTRIMETTRTWEPTPAEAAVIASAKLESDARMRRRRLRKHAETLADHLRAIVETQEAFFYWNEHGTQATFQKAADAFHASIDTASNFLLSIGESENGGDA
jgi:DNA-directed RNA polymerase specialized sigma54-like protein